MLSYILLQDVQEYINARKIFVPAVLPQAAPPMGVMADSCMPCPKTEKTKARVRKQARPRNEICLAEPESAASMPGAFHDISSLLAGKDESFSVYLLGKIDASGMTDADCYTKALVSRQLFNKIKNTADYRPSKATVIALGLALSLTPPEFSELLAKAGYALSNNNDFDLIVDYCVMHNIYNVADVNDLLFSFDQPLLGSR